MSEEPIQGKIARYPLLSTEERQAVQAHVEAHPEWAPALEEAQAFDRLLRDAQVLMKDPYSDDALAYYVAAQHFAHHAPPASLQDTLDRIEARAAEDATLRERLQHMRRRLQTAVEASDPVAQFEQLSGHKLDVPTAPAESDDNAGPSDAAGEPTARGATRIYTLVPRWARLAVAAVLAALVLYGVLFLVSCSSQSELDRLAAIDTEELSIEGYTTMQVRSGTAQLDSSTVLYLQALQLLDQAYTAPLGLFPHYDAAKLAQTAALLDRIIAREEEHSFLQLEAYYFLGKVRLAQGQVEAAQEALRQVVVGQGRMMREASALLAELERLRPEGGRAPSDR